MVKNVYGEVRVHQSSITAQHAMQRSTANDPLSTKPAHSPWRTTKQSRHSAVQCKEKAVRMMHQNKSHAFVHSSAAQRKGSTHDASEQITCLRAQQCSGTDHTSVAVQITPCSGTVHTSAAVQITPVQWYKSNQCSGTDHSTAAVKTTPVQRYRPHTRAHSRTTVQITA